MFLQQQLLLLVASLVAGNKLDFYVNVERDAVGDEMGFQAVPEDLPMLFQHEYLDQDELSHLQPIAGET